jgi:hypothetical protein
MTRFFILSTKTPTLVGYVDVRGRGEAKLTFRATGGGHDLEVQRSGPVRFDSSMSTLRQGLFFHVEAGDWGLMVDLDLGRAGAGQALYELSDPRAASLYFYEYEPEPNPEPVRCPCLEAFGEGGTMKVRWRGTPQQLELLEVTLSARLREGQNRRGVPGWSEVSGNIRFNRSDAAGSSIWLQGISDTAA